MDENQIRKLLSKGAVPIGNTMGAPSTTQSPLQFRIYGDKVKNVVVFEFSAPVQFIGFTPEQAVRISEDMNRIGQELKKLHSGNKKRRRKSKSNDNSNATPEI